MTDILGNNDAVLQPLQKTWRRGQGVVRLKEYSGPVAALEGKFNELAASSTSGVDQMELRGNGASGRLQVAYVCEPAGIGTDADLNTIWEVDYLELETPIEQHSHFDGVASTVAGIEQLTKARDAAIKAATYTAVGNNADNLYKFIGRGVEFYPEFGVVIRKTTATNSTTVITESAANVHTVVAQNTIGYPAKIADALPASLEWLKKTVSYRQIGRLRWQVSTEWWGARKWSTILYGGTGKP